MNLYLVSIFSIELPIQDSDEDCQMVIAEDEADARKLVDVPPNYSVQKIDLNTRQVVLTHSEPDQSDSRWGDD